MAIFPFQSIGQALAYYRYKNPTELTRPNLLEKEHRGKSKYQQLTDASRADTWAAVALALFAVEKSITDKRQRLAFNMLFLGTAIAGKYRRELLHPIDISLLLHVHEKTVYKWKRKFYEEMQAEFERRELLPAPEDSNNVSAS